MESSRQASPRADLDWCVSGLAVRTALTISRRIPTGFRHDLRGITDLETMTAVGDRPWVEFGAVGAIIAAIVLAVLSTSTDLRVGLFGFIGTLVGGLLTFEATELAARRNRRAQRRVAGRLLQEDLVFARTRCSNAEANERFWAPRLDLRLDDWQRQRETVSREVSDTAQWQTIAGAFEAMRSVQSKCNALRQSGKEDALRPRIGQESREVITEYLSRSDRALDALRRLSGDRPPDERPMLDQDA